MLTREDKGDGSEVGSGVDPLALLHARWLLMLGAVVISHLSLKITHHPPKHETASTENKRSKSNKANQLHRF